MVPIAWNSLSDNGINTASFVYSKQFILKLSTLTHMHRHAMTWHNPVCRQIELFLAYRFSGLYNKILQSAARVHSHFIVKVLSSNYHIFHITLLKSTEIIYDCDQTVFRNHADGKYSMQNISDPNPVCNHSLAFF